MGHTVEDVDTGGGKESFPGEGRRGLMGPMQLTFQFSAFILVRGAMTQRSGDWTNGSGSCYIIQGSCPRLTATDTSPQLQSFL